MEKVQLFDISITAGNYQESLDISVKSPHSYACFCNSHMVYEHHTNPQFRGVLEEANFVFPDGMPLVYSLKFLRGIKQERIAGNDAISFLIDIAEERNLRLFFIGGSNKVLEKIEDKLAVRGIQGNYYSPPFKPIDEFDFESQAELIQSCDPDIVLVGLGCPKQEIWMHRMKEKIDAPMYGLGGAFLLFAGMDSRAPKWMRDLSLEWLYRLALEPTRLFKRYFVTNTYFCTLFIKELLKKVLHR